MIRGGSGLKIDHILRLCACVWTALKPRDLTSIAPGTARPKAGRQRVDNVSPRSARHQREILPPASVPVYLTASRRALRDAGGSKMRGPRHRTGRACPDTRGWSVGSSAKILCARQVSRRRNALAINARRPGLHADGDAFQHRPARCIGRPGLRGSAIARRPDQGGPRWPEQGVAERLPIAAVNRGRERSTRLHLSPERDREIVVPQSLSIPGRAFGRAAPITCRLASRASIIVPMAHCAGAGSARAAARAGARVAFGGRAGGGWLSRPAAHSARRRSVRTQRRGRADPGAGCQELSIAASGRPLSFDHRLQLFARSPGNEKDFRARFR